MSLLGYIKNEVTRSYLLDHDQERYTLKREKMYTFMRIPRELEKFMSYGFFHCLDSFLFVYTFLPVRVTLALVSIIFRLPRIYFGHYRCKQGRTILPAEIIDMMKVLIILICCYLMSYVDTSMLYHIIKSQSVIKLYLMYNMIEVADRLFSAFGQDTIDALFWTATEPRDRKREHIGLIPHLLLALIYVFLHGLLVLLQATTLNVAINSSNKALLTIMMSNNFVELKGSVFKKFDKNNLFQVSCSDVRERFHLFALLLVVVLQTMKEYGWKEESFWSLAPDCLMVLGAEILVDWLKHAFITRFNEVSADVYKDYTISLAYDLAQTKQKLAFSDHSDIVSRRMGFIPLPLGVVMLRVLYTSIKSTNPGAVLVIMLAYACLFTFRVLCSVVILGKACDLIEEHKVKQRTRSTCENENKQTEDTNKSRSQSIKAGGPQYFGMHSSVMEIQSIPLFRDSTSQDSCTTKKSSNKKFAAQSEQAKSNVTTEKSGLKVEDSYLELKSSSENKISASSDLNRQMSALMRTKSLSSPDLIRPEADYDEDWECEEEVTVDTGLLSLHSVVSSLQPQVNKSETFSQTSMQPSSNEKKIQQNQQMTAHHSTMRRPDEGSSALKNKDLAVTTTAPSSNSQLRQRISSDRQHTDLMTDT